MKDEVKSKSELISELRELRRSLGKVQASADQLADPCRVTASAISDEGAGTEEALRDSEAFNKALFTCYPEETIVVDLEGKIVAWNDARSASGDRVPELGAVMYKDYAAKHSIDMYSELMACMALGGTKHFAERRYKDRDLAITIAPFPHGAIIVSKDITERRQAERALRESEAQKKAILNGITVNLAYVNRDLEIIWVNKTAAESVGKQPEEMVGHACHEFWGQAGKPCGECPAADTLRTGKTTHKMITTPDGRVWDESGAPVFDDDGQMTGVVEIARDITEQKRLEEQLRQSEKMDAIGQLAGGVAHDFNNQLAGIMGYADMLCRRLEDDNCRRYAENILKASRRSRDLTAQLLAFSRKGDYQSLPVDIHDTIHGVVSLLSRSIDKRIEVRQRLDANPSVTVGDPTQLDNALLNLALNARDAMPKGGLLTFSTDTTVLEERFCRMHHDFNLVPGKYLRVSVADIGMGMDAATISRIFEPFFTTKRPGDGTGMGLAAVYGTLVNHGGAILVESDVDVGTTFTVYLPLTEAPAPDRESLVVPITTDEGGAHIMVVDDEEAVRDLAVDVLTDFGYKVTICRDGVEAVEVYRESWQSIDLVVLDMVMPEMGGHDAFLAMKEINPDVKALLSSGYSLAGEARAILDAGVLDFVGKPFRINDLVDKIAAVLV